ncbi:MAG: hypothetical protein HY586_01085 [Candidatus Omnitrophica bacterium]|nr:hypothetical protein [Candidatus Omnitrophota bacterium]
MMDHQKVVLTQKCRTREAGIRSFKLFAVNLPLRRAFKHAQTSRTASESIFIQCVTHQGNIGYGECLPRPYVTGETSDSTFYLLKTSILPRLARKTFRSLEGVKQFLWECDGKAPQAWAPPNAPQSAAWCAVDLALLDVFSREFKEPISQEVTMSPCRYSGVISLQQGLPLILSALTMRLFALRQIKIKVDGRSEAKSLQWVRKILAKNAEIRLDANMAWKEPEVFSKIDQFSRIGIHSFEQPVGRGELDVMARLVRNTQEKIIADESFFDRESLQRLIEKKSCTGINIRLSKCGGLVASLRRAREAVHAGFDVQLGCQVGESSLLSSAQLIFLSEFPQVTCLEGCFGKRLLEQDPATPVLEFGYGGAPPRRRGYLGLGVDMDEEILKRFARCEEKVSL